VGRAKRKLKLKWIGLGVAGVVALAGAGFGAWAVFWTFYNPRVALAPPLVIERPRKEAVITLALAGDFAPADAAMSFIAREGYHYPYLATADVLRSADVSFANLESPVTESHQRLGRKKDYFYRVEPVATEAWTWMGLDLVSLANNHVYDYRARGVVDTVSHLDAAGIAHVGAGADETAARRPVIFDIGGTRVGFLGYLEDKVGYNLYLDTFAVGGRPGVAKLDRRDVAEDVRRLRPLCDVLLVSVHWGENYKPVNEVQARWGPWLLGLGVDIVVGHHPHDVQAVETRGRGVILYSLGNYAWGAPGFPHIRIGFIARVGIEPRVGDRPGRVKFVELLPIAVQNRMVSYQPRPIGLDEVEWLDPFLAATRARGTHVEVDGTVVKLPLPE
jgi:poly-gamma-glutamate capsule biosynthesis protein CapA/YwtB (metallophosphatase superfamily)